MFGVTVLGAVCSSCLFGPIVSGTKKGGVEYYGMKHAENRVAQLKVIWRQGKLTDHNQHQSVEHPLDSISQTGSNLLELLLTSKPLHLSVLHCLCVLSFIILLYCNIITTSSFLFFSLTPPMYLLALSQMQGPIF